MSVAFWNVPDPSVLGLCLIRQNPPWTTSVSTEASHLRRISFELTGSILRFWTFAGGAVFPTVARVIVDGDEDGCFKAL